MGEAKKKSCPKCGASFNCLGENCWCEKFQILPKNLNFIRMTWDECLCPSCLKEFAENKEQLKEI